MHSQNNPKDTLIPRPYRHTHTPRHATLNREQASRLRRVVNNVLALSQRSLLELIESGFLAADFAYSSTARYLQQQPGTHRLQASVPARMVEQFAFPISQLNSSSSASVIRSFTPAEFVAYVLDGHADAGSGLIALAAAEVYPHTAAGLNAYSAARERLEYPSTDQTLVTDDWTHLLTIEEIVPQVCRHLVTECRHPGQAYRLAVRWHHHSIELAEVTSPTDGAPRYTSLLTLSGFYKAVCPGGSYRLSAEQRDIAIESLRDLVVTHGVRLGIVDDRPQGPGHWVRRWFDRFDSVCLFDRRAAVRRTRRGLCRMVVERRGDARFADAARHDVEMVDAAMNSLLFPLDDPASLRLFLEHHLSYRVVE